MHNIRSVAFGCRDSYHWYNGTVGNCVPVVYNATGGAGTKTNPGPRGFVRVRFSPSAVVQSSSEPASTRAKSLSKMLCIVENKRFTVEIDSEKAILGY